MAHNRVSVDDKWGKNVLDKGLEIVQGKCLVQFWSYSRCIINTKWDDNDSDDIQMMMMITLIKMMTIIKKKYYI